MWARVVEAVGECSVGAPAWDVEAGASVVDPVKFVRAVPNNPIQNYNMISPYPSALEALLIESGRERGDKFRKDIGVLLMAEQCMSGDGETLRRFTHGAVACSPRRAPAAKQTTLAVIRPRIVSSLARLSSARPAIIRVPPGARAAASWGRRSAERSAPSLAE